MNNTAASGDKAACPKRRLASGGFLLDCPTHDEIIGSNTKIMQIRLGWSLTPEQLSGDSNVDIIDGLSTDLQAAKDPANWFAEIQWELRSAGALSEAVRRMDVCAPRMIQPKHVMEPRSILRTLRSAKPESPDSVLKDQLEELCVRSGTHLADLDEESDERLRGRLAALFGGLPRGWWRPLPERGVKLEYLKRVVRGRTWTEERGFPASGAAVNDDQDRRLSVFGIEALIQRGWLARTEYISTATVIDHGIDQASREGFIPDYIFLYAHEVHGLPRARRQVIEKVFLHAALASDPRWLLAPERVIYRGGSDRWGWPNNAQEHTRTLENWLAYNGSEAAAG